MQHTHPCLVYLAHFEVLLRPAGPDHSLGTNDARKLFRNFIAKMSYYLIKFYRPTLKVAAGISLAILLVKSMHKSPKNKNVAMLIKS